MLILWCLGLRRLTQHLWLAVIPAVICVFYYLHAPKYLFWFGMEPEQLVRDNFARERFYVLVMMSLVLLLNWGKRFFPAGKALFKERLDKSLAPYLAFTYACLMSTLVILFLFTLKAAPNNEGFAVSNRYFIYLTPIGVIATTWFSIAIVKFFNGYRWLQLLLAGLMLYWAFLRFYKIVPSALRSIMGG